MITGERIDPAGWLRTAVMGLAWALVASISGSRASAQTPPPLAGASLEDLMKIDVTSVSKKDQTLSRTGAAVFVIGAEDIRRSGAANIPDVLRMAPGVEVAQINSNQWAVSIRGFNAVYSNKVLVLIDGRSVYTSSFSGVYWDQVDTPLEDIERIEVIRGPGGTVWGANAVNGVINIITKSAADTKGGTVVAASGSREPGQGLLQFGGDAGSQGAYRIFGKYFDTYDSPLPGGHTAVDGWHTSHLGGRADWGFASGDSVSVQGDFFSGSGGATSQIVSGYPPAGALLNTRLENKSGDALAKWDHKLANGSQTTLQIYDSRDGRTEDGNHLSENILDVEYEHHLAAGTRHDIVWGLDYRFTREEIDPFASYGIQVNPPQRSDHLFAAFMQDEIQLSRSVFLTVGSKIEHNAYTGLELEPSLQLVWNTSDRQTVWASAGRSIREPDTLEHGMTFDLGTVPVPGFGNGVLVLSGNAHLQAERLTDYETGYRAQLNPRASIDLTGFLSFYHHLLTTETGDPYVSLSQNEPELVIPLHYENLAHACDYGMEVFGNWQVTPRWKLSPGITVLRMSLADDPGGNDATIVQTAGDSPRQQAEIRSRFKLLRNLDWDGSLKYVDSLDCQGIPAYTRLDMRLGWRFGEKTEFSLSGENLTSGGHFEFIDRSGLFTPSLIARSVSGKLTWWF